MSSQMFGREHNVANGPEADEYWGHGRLVIRRPELSDTKMAQLIAVSNRAELLILNDAIGRVVQEARAAGAAQLQQDREEAGLDSGQQPPMADGGAV